MLRRTLIFFYGIFCYVVFVAAILYSAGFLAHLPGFESSNAARFGLADALVFNVALFVLFAAQQAVMSSPRWKRMWSCLAPEAAERSTFVLASSLALITLFRLWQPIDRVIWDFHNIAVRGAIYGIFALGWFTVLLSAFLIDHFDAVGLRQVYAHFHGQMYTRRWNRRSLYHKYVRTPLCCGFVVVLWSTPLMTAAHFFLAAVMSLYLILVMRIGKAGFWHCETPADARENRRVFVTKSFSGPHAVR
jgi:hypothetical protein